MILASESRWSSPVAVRCVETLLLSRGCIPVFVEAVIPYSHAALTDYLGCPPSDSSASGPVAKQLASVALERAGRLRDEHADSIQPVGIALVAALPTTPRRRGQGSNPCCARPRLISVAKTGRAVVAGVDQRCLHPRAGRIDCRRDDSMCDLPNCVESDPDDSFFRDAELKLETLRFEA